MKFTGRSLALVLTGLRNSLFEINNQIVTCPDPLAVKNQHALNELYALRAEHEALIARIERQCNKET